MKEIKIDSKEKGQRFDKFLIKYFPKAGSGFLYKMLRKKNITLNNKKADGSERLAAGDSIQIYFSEETFVKFHNGTETQNYTTGSAGDKFRKAYSKIGKIECLFENEDIIILNKPVGVLSQSTEKQELSLNEWLIGYLISKDFSMDFTRFKPSVCNRLDRNTSGIVLCAKTYAGSRYLSEQIRSHSMQKFYYAVAEGCFPEEENKNKSHFQETKAYLYKNKAENQVSIYDEIEDVPKALHNDCHEIHTKYRIIGQNQDYSLLEIQLITGKSHQIRAQLAHMGHPLAGDIKYGGHLLDGSLLPAEQRRQNKNISVYSDNSNGINFQLLHAAKVVFPKTDGNEFGLSGKIIECKPPIYYYELTN